MVLILLDFYILLVNMYIYKLVVYIVGVLFFYKLLFKN